MIKEKPRSDGESFIREEEALKDISFPWTNAKRYCVVLGTIMLKHCFRIFTTFCFNCLHFESGIVSRLHSILMENAAKTLQCHLSSLFFFLSAHTNTDEI